jgi:hypothetical protein
MNMMNERKKWVVGGLLVAAFAASAFAAPGDGIHAGRLSLSPFLSLGGFYEDDRDRDEDVFLDASVGLRSGYTALDLDANALGFFSSRSYVDADDRDFEAEGGLFRLKYGDKERILLQGNLGWRRVEDIDLYGAEASVGGVSSDSVLDAVARSRRDVSQAGISAGRDLTDKLAMDLGYRFDAVDYRDDALQDLSSHLFQQETVYAFRDKTAGLVTLIGGVQEYDDFDNSAGYYAARLGVVTRRTAKVSLKAGVGAQLYDRQDDLDEESGFNFDVGTTWQTTDKVTLQAGARNGYQLSPLYEENAAEFTVFWIGGSFRLTPSIDLSANAAYRVDDYIDPVRVGETSVDREDKGFALRFRADYQMPARFMRVYTELSHEFTDSTLGDFDQTRLGIGLQLRY